MSNEKEIKNEKVQEDIDKQNKFKSVMLSDLTDNDLDEIALEFIEFLESLTESNIKMIEAGDKMSGKELNAHIENVLAKNNGSFFGYENDPELEEIVSVKLRRILMKAYNFVDDESFSSESYLDLDKMTDEQSENYMFASSQLFPFTLSGKYFVSYDVYGQGESFLSIDEVDKDESKYILEYADLNFIKD